MQPEIFNPPSYLTGVPAEIWTTFLSHLKEKLNASGSLDISQSGTTENFRNWAVENHGVNAAVLENLRLMSIGWIEQANIGKMKKEQFMESLENYWSVMDVLGYGEEQMLEELVSIRMLAIDEAKRARGISGPGFGSVLEVLHEHENKFQEAVALPIKLSVPVQS